MCYRDSKNVPVVAGDVVEYKSKQYLVKVIEEYDMATEVIAEDIKTHKVKTLLLRDIKKV